MDNLILIAAVDAEHAAKGTQGSLEDRLHAAMQATATHWMVTDEDSQFKAAVLGCRRTCDEDETERIDAELRRMQLLAGLMSGLPIDVDRLTAQMEAETAEPLAAQKMWREVKDGARA
jgi:hypothetical protein